MWTVTFLQIIVRCFCCEVTSNYVDSDIFADKSVMLLL